mmetsp:Transcript_15475/g.39000  ORF Transcript_15475/g.39000 Transcript_15475/m.39000 type:complete len:89 (+) Transcript_15475:125-391(+)
MTNTMETQTSTPTPFPIMILDDSLDYSKDDYASVLKQQNDFASFLSRRSSLIVSQQFDKKNKMLIRLCRIGGRKKDFRKSLVRRGVTI